MSEHIRPEIMSVIDQTKSSKDTPYQSFDKSSLIQELAGAALVKMAMFLDGTPGRVMSDTSLTKINKLLNKAGLALGGAEVRNDDDRYFIPVVGPLTENTTREDSYGNLVYEPPAEKPSAARKFKPLVKMKSP